MASFSAKYNASKTELLIKIQKRKDIDHITIVQIELARSSELN
jgi:hypothetical protein